MSKLDEFKQLLSGGCTSDYCLFCHGEDLTIRRGETTLQTFRVNFSPSFINKILITYKQNDKVIINRTLDEVKSQDSIIYYTLSEEDTLKFNDRSPVLVQVKIELLEGEIIISPIYKIEVISILSDSELNERIHLYLNALDIFVIDQKIDVNVNYPLYTNGKGVYKCKLNFDNSWNDFSRKEVLFKDTYNNEVKVLLGSDNECYVPEEVLTGPGDLNIGVIGYYMANSPDGEVEKPTEWSNSIRIELGGK